MRKTIFLIPAFILCILPFDPSFTDVSDTLPQETAANSMDIAVVDMDKDGDLDIILAMEWRPNLLLLNDGKGRFSLSPKPNFLPNNFDSEDIAVADFDKDGDQDIVLAAEDDGNHEYYLNEGGGQLSIASFRFPNFISNSVATTDLDGDGYADLVFGNQGPERIYINDKKGGFIDESAKRIPEIDDVTQDVKFADIDKDGDPDILAGNEDGNRIYINDGKGIFKDETGKRLPVMTDIETRKVTLADIDGDNDLDMFYSNVAFKPGRDLQDKLLINDGKGVFTDATKTHFTDESEHTPDAIFMDIDNDKDPDLLIASFNQTGVRVYRNDGKGKFMEKVTGFIPEVRGQGISIINADFNGDKLEDIYVGNFRSKDFLFIRNR